MTLAELLIQIPGVTLRQIKYPGYVTYDARHYDESRGDVKFTQTFKSGRIREFIRRPKPVGPLHNKWLAMQVSNGDSIVTFNIKSPDTFIAETPEEALTLLYNHIQNIKN